MAVAPLRWNYLCSGRVGLLATRVKGTGVKGTRVKGTRVKGC